MSEVLPNQDERTIFERVAELSFPLGHYAVMGGSMEAHGIRKARDVDVVVSSELFDELIIQGWPPYCLKPCCMGTAGTRRRLEKGDVQINSEISWEGILFADTSELIKNAVIIQELPFAQLDVLAAWKRARGRDKDIKDIELIETYLATRPE